MYFPHTSLCCYLVTDNNFNTEFLYLKTANTKNMSKYVKIKINSVKRMVKQCTGQYR